MEYCKTTVEIVKRSITALDVDAIVNAANAQLQEGGGVCGAIFNAAGSKELQKACDAIGYCPTGNAVVTPGFKTKAKYIIHAVGPIWYGTSENRRQLMEAYTNALIRAKERGCKTIAFPLISAGIYGCPKDIAWEVALEACKEYPFDGTVYFAIPDERIMKTGIETMERMISKSEQLNRYRVE